MPEMRFDIEWPDGSQEKCYSPSSVVKDYLKADTVLSVNEFVSISGRALMAASDRVQQKYGYACSSALDQLKSIQLTARKFSDYDNPKVIIKKIA